MAAVLLRLPTVVSRAPLTYDDSIYLASVGALRDGGLPFRDVFSSQGPAFLPLLWVADLAGLRTTWAPRLLPLLAGVALVVLVHRLALRAGDRAGAALAALLVATSGCLMFTTDRIESDGVAAAFAAAAVLAACGSRTRHSVTTAVLLGVAVAVKSLFVAPAALAALWLVARRRGWRAALAVGAGATAVLLLLALPWGLGAVWDQYVRLHLDVGGQPDLGANADLLLRALRHRDRLLLATGLVALGTVAWRRVRSTSVPVRPERDLAVAAWIWLVASVVVLLLHDPLFLQHLTILVPPAALLVARHRPPAVVAVAILLVLLPAHAHGAGWRASSPSPNPAEEAAIMLLRRVEPAGGLVISDEPALAWLAGRTSPGSVVDLSFVRIAAGDLVTADVVEAAREPGVCAILFWTGRLDQLPHLRAMLTDYRSVFRHGTDELLLRTGCDLADADGPVGPR